MPEETGKNIRIPVTGETGKHSGHNIRTLVVSTAKGLKALYCIKCKKIITYIFAKSKGWDNDTAKELVKTHTESIKSLSEVNVDQEDDFLQIVADMKDGSIENYIPNSPPLF